MDWNNNLYEVEIKNADSIETCVHHQRIYKNNEIMAINEIKKMDLYQK